MGRSMRSGREQVRSRGLTLSTRNSKFARGIAEFRIPSFEFRSPVFRPRTSGIAIRSAFPGFTLLELMIVITLILILASFAMPTYQVAIIHAREAVLRSDLFTMRKMIDEYTIDKQHPPASLDELVSAGYLRGGIPADPFTGSNETWKTDVEDVPISPDQAAAGIVDVHSGADDTSLEGTPYSSW